MKIINFILIICFILLQGAPCALAAVTKKGKTPKNQIQKNQMPKSLCKKEDTEKFKAEYVKLQTALKYEGHSIELKDGKSSPIGEKSSIEESPGKKIEEVLYNQYKNSLIKVGKIYQQVYSTTSNDKEAKLSNQNPDVVNFFKAIENPNNSRITLENINIAIVLENLKKIKIKGFEITSADVYLLRNLLIHSQDRMCTLEKYKLNNKGNNKNKWTSYLEQLNRSPINKMINSLRSMKGTQDLQLANENTTITESIKESILNLRNLIKSNKNCETKLLTGPNLGDSVQTCNYQKFVRSLSNDSFTDIESLLHFLNANQKATNARTDLEYLNTLFDQAPKPSCYADPKTNATYVQNFPMIEGKKIDTSKISCSVEKEPLPTSDCIKKLNFEIQDELGVKISPKKSENQEKAVTHFSISESDNCINMPVSEEKKIAGSEENTPKTNDSKAKDELICGKESKNEEITKVCLQDKICPILTPSSDDKSIIDGNNRTGGSLLIDKKKEANSNDTALINGEDNRNNKSGNLNPNSDKIEIDDSVVIGGSGGSNGNEGIDYSINHRTVNEATNENGAGKSQIPLEDYSGQGPISDNKTVGSINRIVPNDQNDNFELKTDPDSIVPRDNSQNENSTGQKKEGAKQKVTPNNEIFDQDLLSNNKIVGSTKSNVPDDRDSGPELKTDPESILVRDNSQNKNPMGQKKEGTNQKITPNNKDSLNQDPASNNKTVGSGGINTSDDKSNDPELKTGLDGEQKKNKNKNKKIKTTMNTGTINSGTINTGSTTITNNNYYQGTPPSNQGSNQGGQINAGQNQNPNEGGSQQDNNRTGNTTGSESKNNNKTSNSESRTTTPSVVLNTPSSPATVPPKNSSSLDPSKPSNASKTSSQLDSGKTPDKVIATNIENNLKTNDVKTIDPKKKTPQEECEQKNTDWINEADQQDEFSSVRQDRYSWDEKKKECIDKQNPDSENDGGQPPSDFMNTGLIRDYAEKAIPSRFTPTNIPTRMCYILPGMP